MNNSQENVVEVAHGNLLSLRDSAFFEKLKQAYDIQPQNDSERLSLIKMADDLFAAEEAGALQQSDRFSGFAKAASDTYGHIGMHTDVEALERKTASDLLTNQTLRDSAAIVFANLAS